jgi:hypothetical protein
MVEGTGSTPAEPILKEREIIMKPEELWEIDDGESMDDLIRVERFIKSQGVNAAQIWLAWYHIKQKNKLADQLLSEHDKYQKNLLGD